MEKQTEKAFSVTIDATLVTGLLVTFTHMGNAARIENDAQRQAAGEKAIVWQDLCVFGAKCLKDAGGNHGHAAIMFNAYWQATKAELTKPSEAAKYGSEPNADGKFTVNKYLGQCVSRVNGALKRGIATVAANNKAVGLNAVANAVSEHIKNENEAKAKKAEREAQKNDPQRKTRLSIAASCVEIGENVAKGSHDSETLNKVDKYLKDISEILKANEKAMEKEAEAAKAAATKKAQAEATKRGGTQHSGRAQTQLAA